MPATKTTGWFYDGTLPSVQFNPVDDDANNELYAMIISIRFKRHRLFFEASGAFVNNLGFLRDPSDIFADTGTKRITPANAAGGVTRVMVCVVDEIVTDTPMADMVRQNQVWESRAEPVPFIWPT